MDLFSQNTIKELMRDAGITFRRDYGQNFLTSRTITERIADDCSDTEDCMIFEIGPGIGTLTKELAMRYRKVVAVEIDSGIIPVLGRTLSEFENVKIINADIMKTDIRKLTEDESQGLKVYVCANLPYYITTPILMSLLECGVPFEAITVMVQSEVASRLCAAPGTAEYGAITAVLGYYGSVSRLFTVPAGCFIPMPKVNSAVVRIDLFRDRDVKPKDEKLFFATVRAAFEMRRKTLSNALYSAFPQLGKQGATDAITACGFRPDIRGERLSTSDFIALSDRIYERLRYCQADNVRR